MKQVHSRSHARRARATAFVLSRVGAAVLLALPMAARTTEPEDVSFDAEFLKVTGTASVPNVDISRFNKGNVALPGRYRATLYVNGDWAGIADIDLHPVGDPNGNPQALFTRDLLMRVGVDLARLPAESIAKLSADRGGAAAPLPALVPQATATFDVGEGRLDLSIPQAMMRRNARGWVDPQFWDDGVPAAIVQYNANVYHASGRNFSTTQSYLGLNAGANLGAWRFRYNGNVTNTTGQGTHVQSMQTYLQRSFAPINSQLTLGDSFTDGSIFDSFGVRGVQLGTDDRMYPDSQRGFAPTVRGIANTNAKVEIRQNGNIIYTTTVAPGAFEINDLFPTGYGGDLQVIVTEADGSQRVTVVPYAAPVNALREGRWRYSVAAGQYRHAGLTGREQLAVLEANVAHGLDNLVTLYGGTIGARDYFSVAGGVALNTSLGAIAFDATHANTRLDNTPSRSGQSYRLAYSRVIAPTDTNVTLAAYRYSTKGFLSLNDAMKLHDDVQRGIPDMDLDLQKGRMLLTINQSLGNWGSVYLSGFTQNYWNRPGRDTAFQLGYNTNIGRVGVGLSLSRQREPIFGGWDNRVMATLNVPLDIGTKIANTSTNFTHDSRDHSNQLQQTFSGSLGDGNEFNYGVTAGHSWGGSSGSDDSISANVGYLSPYTQLRANASSSNGFSQLGAGLSGTIVAYQGGVVVSPQTGDTFAVVEAEDAANASVSTSPGVQVDSHGHALIANMQPFSQNAVNIDPKGLPMGVTLNTTEQRFAPTAGAVVRVKFDTMDRGRMVVMRLRQSNGEPVPFGAAVMDAKGDSAGSVTQGSRAMFYGNEPQGELLVRWGEGAGQSCKVRYSLPPAQKDKPETPVFADAVCQPRTGDVLVAIEAKDAAGASVSAAPGVQADSQGRAPSADMQPVVARNAVDIDPKGPPMAAPDAAQQRVAAAAGAAGRTESGTVDRGRMVMMRLRQPNDAPIPFGAEVVDAQGATAGWIAQGSRTLLHGNTPEGDLLVKWGEDAGQSCKVRYSLPPAQKNKPQATVFADAVCQPQAGDALAALDATQPRLPAAGAAVERVKSGLVDRGRMVMMLLHQSNDAPIPFGAEVVDTKGDNVGWVTQGSRALFHSNAPEGYLVVKWEEGAWQSCKVRYSLPPAPKNKPQAPVFSDAVCL
jgi:outer membrane usher protein